MAGRQYQDAAGRLPYRNRSLNTSSVQPVAHTPTSRTPSPTPTSILTSSPTISNPSQSPTPPQTPGPVPPGTAASGSSSANIKDKPFPRPPVSKWSFKSFSSFGSEKIKDHNLPSWKPFTLRLPYLIFLILLTLFFIISIELLFRKSQRDGYLTFAQGDGLNGWQIFVSQYMGTVASVIFAILLSLSDLDAKRLEPWFELSKPDGVTAQNSILLCYPFDFLAFVPFKAAKRGHWSVFHIGTATVLVFWFITPLQSSLIATVQQQVFLPATFMTTKSLKKLSAFGPEIGSFTNVAYSISWLNSTAPAYSTKSEAVLPFEPVSISGSDIQNTLWIGNSTAYYSKVDCRPAERIIIRDQNRPMGAEVQDNERFFHDRQTNCSFRHAGFPKLYKPGPGQPWRQWYAQFVGYNAGAKVQYYLKTPTCMIPEDPEPSLFLVVFSHQRDYNATPTVAAVFCEPKYQRSPVEAVVDARTRFTKNIRYIGPSQELTPDQFNATIFETVVSGGGVGLDATNGGPFNLAPQHTTKTKEINDLLINSDWVFESNALGYLFAIDSNLEKYLNVDFLAKTIDKAYKLLFTTYAATKLMVPEDRYVDGSGRVSFTTEVVVVPEVFVRILEGLLSAVALFLTCFLISSTRRRTGLVYDPASLAGTMALVASEPKLLEKFAALDGVSTAEKLYQAVGDDKLKFKLNTQSEQYQLTVLPAPGNASPSVGRAARNENEQETNFELGAAAGTTFILFLGSLLGFMAYIFHYSTTNEGLPSFSGSIFVSQLLFSYTPTAIGTFLEPFWVLLTRFICVLQPLETLRHGHATASESLTLKFESVPPILTLFPAFKSKHYFLSILAATALSTNILAIALGALFDPDTVLSPTPVEYTDSFLPSIEALPFPWDSSIIDNASIPVNYFAAGRYDHYYKIYANLTTNTPLPSWTTLNHFFLPVKPSSTRLSNSSDLLQVETIGFNANLSCETIEVPLSSESNLVKLHVEATAFENSGPLCEFSTNFDLYQLSNSGNLINEGYEGLLAMQAYPILFGSSNTTRDNRICAGLVPAIFSRAQALTGPPASSNYTNFNPRFFSYKSIICRPRLSIHRYDVTLDAFDQVVSALPKNTSIDESSRVFSGGVTETQLLETIRRFLQSDLDTNKYGILSDMWLRFNRDSLPSGWIDFMIQQISNSTKAFDPQTPFQDVDMSLIGEHLSESYSRVFAAILGIYYDQMFARAPDSTSRFQGTKLIPTIRMQMSTAMFAIVASLLGWYFLLAIHFYIFRVSRLFQRLPTSIASEIQLFHKSSVLDDVRGTELLTSRQREDYLSKLNQRYGYGRFKGKDGVQRIGIEREPLLDHMSNQEVRNQGLGKVGLTIEHWMQWAKRTLT
ncbi:hypothetical protein TWF102_009784 [Orbilia oligospora]|uniref:Uncharacterized protein n=1 Tax=Orbilia oligospora TaxID=2813651 RepID=A0A7C8NJD4_ORBOL|nr:hypothetical protein TWF102_009784 [Orbilia oligospora]KAF3102547.1 hypothetical protein TWF706_005193 [Orbilia oligospora]KAF3110095.1 hypothetical protein TWF103_004914 [Orbilia oligospora]KAF3153205.1 hypothetical protein TWF594_000237 [Orbilia oligospora]